MPRRDRDGSVIGEDVVDPTEIPHRCRQGWLSSSDDDQPRPCPTCRPWLTARPPRPPTEAERAELLERHGAPAAPRPRRRLATQLRPPRDDDDVADHP